MSVTKDINLGTLIPLFVWIAGATITAVLWGGQQAAEVREIREWQVRQDSRIGNLEQAQVEIIRQNAQIEAIVGITRDEVLKIGDLLLSRIQQDGEDG